MNCPLGRLGKGHSIRNLISESVVYTVGNEFVKTPNPGVSIENSKPQSKYEKTPDFADEPDIPQFKGLNFVGIIRHGVVKPAEGLLRCLSR